MDLWDACHALGAELDGWHERLANDNVEMTEADGAELDGLVGRAGDLRAQYLSSPVLGPNEDDELVRLYDAPISPDALGASLDDLVRRAATTRDRVWARVGGRAPVSPVFVAREESSELLYPEVVERDASGALVPVDTPVGRGWDPWRVTTEALTAMGVLIVVFVLYATFGTGLSAARSQRALEREFDARLRSAVAASNQATGDDVQGSGVLTGGEEPDVDEPEAPEEPVTAGPLERGDPVGILSLPTVGARDMVVEGTRAEELTAGPGHLRSSPMPGRVGNAVVFGRRTTYGGPFRHLDDLQPGDPMDVTTTEGVFRYVVQEVRRVGTGEPDPIGSTFSNRLTLVTADEHYAARGRLVAIGLLQGPPVPSPTTEGGSLLPLPAVNPDELGTERTGTDWAWVLIWTQVLVLAYLGTRWLYRHWLPWSSWLVSAPVVLVVTFAWLDSLARLFPSTL